MSSYAEVYRRSIDDPVALLDAEHP